MDNTGESLLIFTRRQIAKTLASAFLLGGAQFSRHCANALGFSGEAVAAPAGSALATLTLVNSGGATQPSGVPTQTFGQPFKDGDIAPGTAPQFTVAGVSQPFSAGLQSYWPSGCLKFATFMLLPTFSLAAGASRVVTIARGGSWPAASRRTLGEVYAQNLVVTAPAYPSPHNSRSGTYGAWLLGDANNYKQVVWLDGAAGKAWKISTHMAQTRGGAKDGMLVCDHYIMALNNASGGLGGFRWMGAIRQPFYNAEGAPASGFVFFSPPSAGDPSSGLNWSVGGGTPTPLPWPFKAHGFTNAADTNIAATTAANGYYSGASSDGNIVPIVLTGASLPTTAPPPPGSGGIADGNFAFLMTSGNDPRRFYLHWSGTGGAYARYNFTSPGGGTITPVPGLWSFNRIMFATKDAKYNFFQGTGSIAAETTLRAQINQSYWQSSRLFQPLDLTLRGSSTAHGGPIADTKYPFDWNPYCIADFLQAQPGGGDHTDIGMLPNLAVLDFYNQSTRSEKVIRIIGLCPALQIFDFKDAATDAVVNLSGINNYTGLPPASADVADHLGWPGLSAPQGTGAIGFNGSGTEHEPNYSYWAYLRTGEVQYLDFIVDIAIGQVLTSSPRKFTPGTAGISYTVYGVIDAWDSAGGELRSRAWAHRDIEFAALIYPFNPADPTALGFDGTQTGKYLNDLADANANFPLDQFNAGAAVWGEQNAYIQARGLWMPCTISDGVPLYGMNGPEWEFADFVMAMCVAAVRGNAKAALFLANVAAPRWNYIGTNYKGGSANGFWHLYAYQEFNSLYDPANPMFGRRMIGADDEWSIIGTNFYNPPGFPGLYITWAPNSPGVPAFTLNGANSGRGYVPSNGDKITPKPDGGAGATGNGYFPSALTLNRQYWIINLTGTGPGAKFDLCASPPPAAGPAVAITDSTNNPLHCLAFTIVARNPPITNWPFTIYYPINIRAAACWANAIGISGFANVINDVNYRFRNTPGGPYTTYQTSSSGNYETVDARYCNQPTFA